MNLSLVFDVLLIALLGVTLAYGYRLNRRLERVRAGHAEFHALLGKFGEATEQAARGVAALKMTAAEAGQNLQETTERAASLREDLTFLVDRASELADRVEGNISRTRTLSAAAPHAVAPEPRAAAKPPLAEIVATAISDDPIPTSLAAAARTRARAQRRAQPEARKPMSADDQRLFESLASLR